LLPENRNYLIKKKAIDLQQKNYKKFLKTTTKKNNNG